MWKGLLSILWGLVAIVSLLCGLAVLTFKLQGWLVWPGFEPGKMVMVYSLLWWFFLCTWPLILALCYRRLVLPGTVLVRFGPVITCDAFGFNLDHISSYEPGKSPVVIPWLHDFAIVPHRPLKFYYQFSGRSVGSIEIRDQEGQSVVCEFTVHARLNNYELAASTLVVKDASLVRGILKEYLEYSVWTEMKNWMISGQNFYAGDPSFEGNLENLRLQLEQKYLTHFGYAIDSLVFNRNMPTSHY
jgi:hypothetical protein